MGLIFVLYIACNASDSCVENAEYDSHYKTQEQCALFAQQHNRLTNEYAFCMIEYHESKQN